MTPKQPLSPQKTGFGSAVTGFLLYFLPVGARGKERLESIKAKVFMPDLKRPLGLKSVQKKGSD